MSTFMQYAISASSEALEDAGWRPRTDHQREMTVSHNASIAKKDDTTEQKAGRMSRFWYRKPRNAISDLNRSSPKCELY